MQLNERIDEILSDLYRIDPGFKASEQKLRKLLSELLSVRPDVTLDEEFVNSLRHQLMAAAREMENSATSTVSKRWLAGFALKWAGSLALIAVVAGAAIIFAEKYKNPASEDTANLLASKIEVQALGASAFGSLRDVQLAVATGKGGGGGGGNAVSKDAAAPLGMGGGGYIEGIINYTYKYKGEEFELPPAQMDVYRREKGLPHGLDATSILKNLDFGILNAGVFENLRVDSLNLAEDRDFGYSIYLSLQEGMITIGQNWSKWPTMDKLCQGRGEACFRENQMKIDQIPDDAAVIEIANGFLRDHNISTESYGEPYVNNFWKAEYERATDKSMVYIPDILNVVYPLKLNDKEVYDEGGSRVGLTVTVDARHLRAAGLMDLTSQRYQSSSYESLTDKNAIIGLAEKGGYHGGYYENGGRTVNVELGAPTLDYIKVWQYENSVTNELIVPALVFPVINPDPAIYRKNVVVPVIKDIMAQDTSRAPIDILPMPAQ